MNKQHWTNSELSKKLEALGVESEFRYYWTNPDPRMNNNSKILIMDQTFFNKEFDQKTFHFSDILLPENAKKIWSIKTNKGKELQAWLRKSNELIYRLRQEVGWQSWLEEEVDKILAKRNEK